MKHTICRNGHLKWEKSQLSVSKLEFEGHTFKGSNTNKTGFKNTMNQLFPDSALFIFHAILHANHAKMLLEFLL
jgi:hypothetical protein